MNERIGKRVHSQVLIVVALAITVLLSLGALMGCSSSNSGGNGSQSASSESSAITKTLVKTAANSLALVDWDVTDADSPLTISSDDSQYADYIDQLRELTGYNIEQLSMQVGITTVQGAEIGATHEFTYENTYTIENLEAVVDGQTITYTEGDLG